jgi:soluble lytic murein transglycosylase-like protein
MIPFARAVRRTRFARPMLVLALTLVPLTAGHGPELPSGLARYRGGDIVLPPPAWERRSILELIQEAAARYGVDPALVRAVVWVESRYDPYAVSPRGARGLMQLTPNTARSVGVANAFDPRQNVFGGVKYLSMLLKEHDGDLRLALASYNAGPTAVRRHGGVPPYGETEDYLTKIRRRFRRLPEPPAAPAEAPPPPAAPVASGTDD